VKIDLTTHEAIEIVGAISDCQVRRAERLVGQTRGTVNLKRQWTRIHGNE